MSINVDFVATVGAWDPGRQQEVLTALETWMRAEWDSRDLQCDIMGGGGQVPSRLEAYSTSPIPVRFSAAWAKAVEQRLHEQIAAVGGSDITLELAFPDEGM